MCALPLLLNVTRGRTTATLLCACGAAGLRGCGAAGRMAKSGGGPPSHGQEWRPSGAGWEEGGALGNAQVSAPHHLPAQRTCTRHRALLAKAFPKSCSLIHHPSPHNQPKKPSPEDFVGLTDAILLEARNSRDPALAEAAALVRRIDRRDVYAFCAEVWGVPITRRLSVSAQFDSRVRRFFPPGLFALEWSGHTPLLSSRTVLLSCNADNCRLSAPYEAQCDPVAAGWLGRGPRGRPQREAAVAGWADGGRLRALGAPPARPWLLRASFIVFRHLQAWIAQPCPRLPPEPLPGSSTARLARGAPTSPRQRTIQRDKFPCTIVIRSDPT
jgi:hypothetical protein